ncbi:MAG: MBL fold metallo-hydrolase [Ruminococcus sp.]|nr:MBL fold metallo-hydrolase [Ruminococcus sp.]
MKKIALAAAMILMTFTLTSCMDKGEKITVEETSEIQQETVDFGKLDLTVFDVGKADSMILTSENSTVIIDCGEKGDGKEIINCLEEKNISSVDYLIITHYDKDHVGGAAKVINNIEVKNVLAPDYEEESEEMEKYNKALNESGITPQLLTSDISFTLGNADYTIYAPKQTYYGDDDDNDFSLVMKVTHGNNVLLFTGDAMEQRLEEIMDIGDCDFLKVPYHGRHLDNLSQFLDAVTPEVAVVCTSKSEFSADTQNELINRNIEYYATCFNGQIKLSSDGNNITVSAEKGA